PAIVVLLASDLGPWRSTWQWKAAACAACLICFLAASWPVFIVYRGAGAPAHDAIMGLAARTEDDLGLTRPNYQRMAGSNDFLIYAQELGYGQVAQELEESFEYDDAQAEAVGKRMLLHMFIRYPADFIAKAYATVLWTLSGATPNYRYQIYQDWGRPFLRGGMVAAAAAVFMLLCARRLRLGWLALFLFLYFTMYTTIQFQYRHVFHLAIFAPWIIGFLVQQALERTGQWTAGKMRSRILDQVGSPRRSAARALGSALAVALLFLVPLHGARAYQAATASGWLHPYDATTRTPVPTLRCETAEWVLFRLADDTVYRPEHEPPWIFEQDYLVAELSGSAHERSVWLVYESLPGVLMGDFSAQLIAPASGPSPEGDLQCFFPVFTGRPTGRPSPDLFFAGIAMKTEDAAGLQGLYRITNPEIFDLTPVVWLPRDRSRFMPYARIGLPYAFDTPMSPPVRLQDCGAGAQATP
ncbi:MAG: hypothetical protein IT368_18235, partial [Candidatus Hydrogenedentes bacterium]|nr:hypothetical protein [Candidatus Hydrogenedentota bacterium]